MSNMPETSEQALHYLLKSLTSSPKETAWIEFKRNNGAPEEVGEYISALSNAASLHKQEAGYLVFGVEDSKHTILGTSFKPSDTRVKQQELESWLVNHLTPRIDFKIHEFIYDNMPIVIFEIPPAWQQPVKFR